MKKLASGHAPATDRASANATAKSSFGRDAFPSLSNTSELNQTDICFAARCADAGLLTDA